MRLGPWISRLCAAATRLRLCFGGLARIRILLALLQELLSSQIALSSAPCTLIFLWGL